MNLKISFCIILFAIIGIDNCFCQSSKADSILFDFNHRPEKILVAAHRAAHQNHPENSIAAIRESIHMGIAIVELDIRVTQDDKLVVMHDRTVDRTTNGSGKVEQLTFEEIRSLRLKHNDNLTDEQVPTLEEVLVEATGKILIDIDFKAAPKHIDKALALIEKHEMEDQIIFFLYDHKLSPKLHEKSPDIIIMPRAHNQSEIEEILKWNYIKVIHVDDSFYDDTLINRILDANVRVWMNALGKYDTMENKEKNSGFDAILKHKNINIIQTDLPEELSNFLLIK
ncbi:glycerophosphoryl diester phosphodiesterase [Maribacter dokdonensis]|uniref:Glycerophosphoryl diester phosphodiesterase n=1 Tax=Maribacter dokdonensis TaxID=320912 RepID=A0A1H4UQ04_9FLAO|nr:glycerophosphodiester phosphodiesterase family protein [Maribacter dokdonensis]SEC70825.1 glycerophosphoryl diester phosphodiesterase [Maribacter dokdonensis]